MYRTRRGCDVVLVLVNGESVGRSTKFCGISRARRITTGFSCLERGIQRIATIAFSSILGTKEVVASAVLGARFKSHWVVDELRGRKGSGGTVDEILIASNVVERTDDGWFGCVETSGRVNYT